MTDRPLADLATRPRPAEASPRSTATPPDSGDRGVPGVRLERLAKRRRLLREELIVVAALLLILGVTVAILAAQWLTSAPTSGALHYFVHLDPGGTT